jgi:hypothetical protein
MKIGTVVEGPTDRLLLEAIISHVIPGEHQFLALQPVGLGASFGETGTGWKGVRRFCQEIHQRHQSNIASYMVDYQLDLLVIHLDADVIREADLWEDTPLPEWLKPLPCPPIAATTEQLKQLVAHWLNETAAANLPPALIFAIPAQDTENWTFAALFPEDPLCQQSDYECLQKRIQRHPAYLLTLSRYGKHLQRQGTQIKKSVIAYRRLIPEIMTQWDRVCTLCTQAHHFQQDFHLWNES